jgi:tRNA pseudouridine38-40 synthase
MPRYKLTIEYDGLPFHGWQRQEDAVPSVQGTIEQAIYQFCQERVTLEGAGRTDAGVHATGQVAHVDLTKVYTAFRLQEALNFYLRESGVAIVQVAEVGPDFHARFSATARIYHYKIINRRAHTPLLAQRAWHIIRPLDIQAMKLAAQAFVGHHDFSSFRSSQCQASSAKRTLDDFTIAQEGDMIIARIQSRSFLHNQVRIMMGTLQQVGHGKGTINDIKQALLGRDRTFAGPTAPAYGLYLTEVQYIE